MPERIISHMDPNMNWTQVQRRCPALLHIDSFEDGYRRAIPLKTALNTEQVPSVNITPPPRQFRAI
jgi:hypothetical protein